MRSLDSPCLTVQTFLPLVHSAQLIKGGSHLHGTFLSLHFEQKIDAVTASG